MPRTFLALHLIAFSGLTLLLWQQAVHLACKNIILHQSVRLLVEDLCGMWLNPSSYSFIAYSTMHHQLSRIAAFLQADARPMFCWPRSASTARSQVWLGLPNSCFQSGGSPRITAATSRWWSSCGELRAICPKSRKRLSATSNLSCLPLY